MSQAGKFWTRIQCDADFDREGRQVTHLFVPHSSNESAWGGVRIPMVVLKRGEGPSLLLTAGTHGDEFEGQIILAELARTLRVEEIQGRVIIIPSLHLPACRTGTRLSSLDGRDLNRSFPGDPAGSFAQMLAHFVTERLLSLVETNIDLHSGGRSLDCLPCTMSHLLDGPVVMKRTMALAAAFGAPLHVMNREVDGVSTFQSAAERLGVISISSELGGSGRVSFEGIEIGRRGVHNALVSLGIMDAEPRTPKEPTRFMVIPSSGEYGFSPVSGLFSPALALGSAVGTGDLLGEVFALAGDPDMPPVPIHATRPGILWCQRGQGRIEAGDSAAIVISPQEALA